MFEQLNWRAKALKLLENTQSIFISFTNHYSINCAVKMRCNQ